MELCQFPNREWPYLCRGQGHDHKLRSALANRRQGRGSLKFYEQGIYYETVQGCIRAVTGGVAQDGHSSSFIGSSSVTGSISATT